MFFFPFFFPFFFVTRRGSGCHGDGQAHERKFRWTSLVFRLAADLPKRYSLREPFWSLRAAGCDCLGVALSLAKAAAGPCVEKK